MPERFVAQGADPIQVTLYEDPGPLAENESMPLSTPQGAIAFGESVSGEISNTMDSWADSWTFEGSAGQSVTIRCNAAEGSETDPMISLYGADETLLISDDDGGEGTNALIENYTLPADGTYTIRVEVFTPGEYVLTLEEGAEVVAAPSGEEPAPETEAPAETAPTPATDDSTTEPSTSGGPGLPSTNQGSIDFGESTTAELDTISEAHDWTFEGNAGQSVTIRCNAAEGSDTDPRIHLYGPDGTVIADDDDSGEDTNALILNFPLTEDGTYTIQIDVFTPGEYVLTLEEAQGGTAAPADEAPADEAPADEAPADEAPAGPVATPAPDAPVGVVINGGNLRDAPDLNTSTVIGQVCPDDQVEFLEQQANWYRIRVYTTAEDCVPQRVAAGTEGWLSSVLVSTPSGSVPGAAQEPAPTQPAADSTAEPAAPADSDGQTASVINGGNLRTEPRIAPDTVIGQVCPGDSAVVLENQQVEGIQWYRIRVTTLAEDCVPERVPSDTEGWLSSVLLSIP
jgi:hypothetical protein